MNNVYSNPTRPRRFHALLRLTMLLAFAASFGAVKAQTTLIGPANGGNFDLGATLAANNWTVFNAANNQWVVGTQPTTTYPATAPPFAGNCAWANGDGVVTNYTYNTAANSAAFIYRDVTIPAGEGLITMTFNWQGAAEANFDMVQVFYGPTSLVPIDNTYGLSGNTTIPPGIVGATHVGNTIAGGAAGIANSVTIVFPAALAGTTVRIFISWKTDTCCGTAVPHAIDNIVMTSEVAVPICGNWTIDNTLPTAGTNFNTFTEAINYINLHGICGPLTFNVTAGQTFAENTPAITATGTPVNTITFQRSGAGANPVITPPGTAGTTDAGITINGSDYLRFNGIDVNGSAVATVEYGYLVRNRNASDGASFNIFENFTVRLNRTNTTSRGVLQTASTTGGGFTPVDNGGTNTGNTYRNFNIRNAYAGFWALTGSTLWPDDGTMITTSGCGTYNSIGDPAVPADIGSTVTALQSFGIQFANQNNFTIQNTEIRNVSNTTSQLDGINVTSFSGACTINNNIIRGIAGTGSTTLAMSGIRAVQSTATGVPTPSMRIYNNMVAEITRAYIGVATATRGPRGLYLPGTSALNPPTYEVWNNTVVLNGSANPNLSNAVFETNNPITGATLIVRNNIFTNLTGAQGITARHYGFVHSANLTTIGNTGTLVTHNDIFISTDAGVSGFTALSLTTNRNGVAAWQGAVAQAASNLEVDPALTSNFEAATVALDGTGFAPTPAYITTDLACAARQADIGAYNINACVTPIAGTITGAGTVCDLSTTVLSLSGASTGLGITYQWAYSTTPGGPYGNLLGTGGTQDVTSLTTGTYYFVVDVTCNAGPTTVTTPEFTLVINPNPSATAGAVDAVLCVGETLDLTGSSDIGTSWAWTGPNAFASAAQNPQRTNMQLADAGNYSLVASAAGCNSAASVVSISVNPLPVITSVTATPNPICLNGNSQLNAIATLPGYAVAGITYGLQPTTGFTNGPTGDDILSAAIPLPFTLLYFNSPKTTFQINTNGQIGFNYTGSTAAQQRTSQLVPDVTLPNDNISLFWTDLNATTAGMIQYGTIGTTPNQIFVVSFNNVPFFTGGGVASGQIHIYETTNVIEMHVTSLTLNATFNRTLGLENATGTDGAAAPGRNNSQWLVGAPEAWRFTPNAPSYSWSPNTFLDFDNIANPLASAVTATTAYTVTATSPANCSAQQGITVTVGATLSAVNITPVAPEYCAGGSILLTATPVDGGAPYTYQWYDPTLTPMGTSATQSANLPGLWSVDVFDNCGNSILGTSVLVIENPTPTASASAGQACMGGTLQLTGTTDIGTTFGWTGPNSFTSALQNPTVNPVVAASAGTYFFTATLGSCSSVPGSVVVAVDASPIISSTTASPNPVCTGNDSQLNVNVSTGSYCIPTYSTGTTSGDWCSLVEIAGTTLNNPTGGNGDPSYVLFPATGSTTATLTAGTLYTMTLSAGTWNSNDIIAWIDYNDNGTFETPAERLGESYNFPAGPATVVFNFTVPMSAINGLRRLRVREADQATTALDPCIPLTFGQVEDYDVTITGGVSGTTTFLWTPNTFLTADNIADPIAETPTATTPYSVLVTGANGCTATGNVTLTVNQTPNVTMSVLDNCGPVSTFTIPIEVNSTGNGPTVDISYTVNGGAPIVVSGLGVGIQPPLGPFAHLDEVVVTVIDPVAGCNVPMGLFRSGCPELITCPAILTKNYCYDNNDTRSWVFTATTPGESLLLSFVSGTMAPGDVIRGYDGTDDTGTPIPSLTGTFATLVGVNGTSVGQSIYLEVESDGSGSCVDGDPQASSWTWQVQCNPSCVFPTGSVTSTSDCFNQTFTLDVEVTFTGDALTTDLEYTVNAGPPTTIPGLVDFDIETIGPFNMGDNVQVFLRHETDGACDQNLGTYTIPVSSCNNDEPCASGILTMNPNYTCTVTNAGDMTGSTLTAGIVGGCTGVVQDEWYRFTATATTHRVQLGGTTTGLSHSIFTGNPDCTSLLLVPGTACVAGATASNPTGLTIGQIYYVRVSRTTVGTNAYTVCVSAPPLLDVDATTLALPVAVACYGATETVSVTVQNTSIYTLDMSVNPLTVNVAVTGAAIANLTGTINSGTLAPAATIVVPMSTTLDMTAVGTYTFNGSAVVVGDGNAANDPMTAATRTTTAPVALPQTNNFTGFTGANLTTVFPNWREATGATVPAGTTSAWTSSVLAQQTQLGAGISARIQMTTTARNEWIVGPKFVPVLGTQLSYRIALTEFGTGGVDAGTPSPGMQPGDQVIVKISTDCGATYTNLLAHTQGVPAVLTNSLVQQIIDLSPYAGQQVIIAFHATKPTSATHPNYDFHLDEINIQNVAVCAGPPIAGTAVSSVTGPVCAPASTTLSISGQSTDGGVTVTWFSSPTPGGPYLTQVGTGTAVVVSALEATTYYVARVRCTLTMDDVFTNEVSIQVTPTPTASASAGPACTGQTLNLNGTTNFGTSFTWSGPNGFASALEDPSIPAITTAAGGTYTFTAIANGCPRPTTVQVAVSNTPVITSVTGTPNPVCIGANSQLNATATLAVAANQMGFSFGTGAALDPMIGASVATGALNDDTPNGALLPIGFNFVFDNVTHTNWSCTPDGFIRLGNTLATADFSNGIAENTNMPKLMPYYDDLATGSNGNVTYLTTGTAPNRILKVQWFIRIPRLPLTDPANSTFQLWLYETTNNIEFRYGAMNASAASASIGIAGGTTNWQSITLASNTVSTAVANDLNAGQPAPGSYYLFTGGTPAFSWSPATYLTATNIANPVALSVAADETYSVTASANGCTSAPSVLLLEANPPIQAGEASITPVTPSFCTGSNVVLTAVPLGGGGPYTFTWTDPNLVVGAPSASPTVSANIPGTWSVLIEDGCASSATASVVVTEYPVPIATASSNSPTCAGQSIALDGGSDQPGSTFAWTGPAGFVSTLEDPVIPSATLAMAGSYSVVATANGCSSAPVATVVLVGVSPTGVSASASEVLICAPGGPVDLSSTGSLVGITIFSENFNAPTNAWTTTSTGSNPAPAAWTLRPNGFVGPLGGANISNDASQFYMSNSDAAGSGSTTNTTLTSPAFSTMGYSAATLSFWHHFQWLGTVGEMANIEISTNGGGLWTTLVSYAADQGTPTAWTNPSLSLNAYLNQASVQVRFHYIAPGWDWYWVVDNVLVTGTQIPSFTWSSNPAGFTSNLQNPVGVPFTQTTTYTVDVSSPLGCTVSDDVTVYYGDQDVTLEIETDGNGAETSWAVYLESNNLLLTSGTGYPNNATVTVDICLPQECMYLQVSDAGLNGITNGGYILRQQGGNQLRIIDDEGNFTSGQLSAIANNGEFCLPLGPDRLIYTSCDKIDWRNNEFIVANDNPMVSAQYGVNNANSGYQMWWYDPNGGYSFRRFQSHNTANGLPASATRACHFRVNGWSGNQLVAGTLYNVKVRGRVNGANNNWGAACRFILDPVRAQCPLTKLMDIPGNQYLSCGATRPVGTGQASLVHARPVTRLNGNNAIVSANRYQFRFRIPAELFSLVKTSQTGQYWVNTNGLSPCKVYEVDVRASFDNGATWCTDFVAPFLTDPWGDVCLLNTTCAFEGVSQNMGTGPAALTMYPNPNRGDQLFLGLDAIEEGVMTIGVEIIDAFGKRVSTRTIPVQDGFVNTMMSLNGELAGGLYMVNITAGDARYTERLVIQP